MSSSMGQGQQTSASMGQPQPSMGGQLQTPMSNEMFDLVSVLYFSLEADYKHQRYIDDAQQAGDNDLVQFFQQCQQEDRQRAQQARQLLNRKIQSQMH